MKLVLMALILISSLYGKSKLEYAWSHLSTQERMCIFNSYRAGLKYDIGLTLAAINWQESVGGRYRISIDGNDVGIYHVNLYWYFKEFNIENTMWNRSKYATILITKPKIEEAYVITKLINLKLIHKHWIDVWTAYNGSKEYSIKILNKVRFLRRKFKHFK